MSHTTLVTSHVAGLAGDSEQVISGVAVGVDDVTRGLSGDRKVWTAEELRAAASTLEGTPVNPLHSGQDVGEVTRAGFEPGRGVIYEARIEDEALARQAADGHLEVSIEARHVDGGTVETDEGEAMLAADIKFTGLSLVQRGAAPSASASPGEAAALSASAIHAALAEDDPASTEGDASDIEISDAVEEGLENKVEEHNEQVGSDKEVTLGTLKKVFRRGAGAWLNSNAGATQQQWAYARVNAFLEDLRNDRALNAGNDNDLAPEGYDPPGESESNAAPVEGNGKALNLLRSVISESESNAALVDVNGTEVDIEPPERVTNAIEAALDAKEEYADAIGDCGTGVGEAMGQAILDGPTVDLLLDGADVASNSPATYLDSHSEDVAGIDAPPTEWGREEWLGLDSEDDDPRCGPVQHALWGHYTEWFEDTKAEIEAAMEDSDMAKHYNEDAEMAETPDEYIFDNPGEAVAKAEEMGVGEGEDLAGDEMIHSHGDGEDTVFMPAPSHDALMEMLEEMGELAEARLKAVGPVEFDDTGEGELDESDLPNDPDEYEGHYLNAEDTKSASSFPLVDADGVLRRGNLDAAWNLRGQGDLGMPRDAAERVMRSLGEEFGEPGSEANPIPEEAYEDAEMAPAVGATDDPEPGEVAGGEPEARTGARLTETPDTMGTNTTDPETVEELRADLQQKEETVAELRDRVEQLEAERGDVAEAYADALAAGDTVLDAEDFAEKFTVAELRERYEATEDATLADTEPAVQSGDTGTPETASLSDAESEEVAERREAIAALAGSSSDFARTQAEQHAERIAELTGEDTDAILAEMD